jgi:hypothetical protein
VEMLARGFGSVRAFSDGGTDQRNVDGTITYDLLYYGDHWAP